MDTPKLQPISNKIPLAVKKAALAAEANSVAAAAAAAAQADVGNYSEHGSGNQQQK